MEKTRCCKKWKITLWFRNFGTNNSSNKSSQRFPITRAPQNIEFALNFYSAPQHQRICLPKKNEAVSAPTIGPDRQIKPLTGVLDQRQLKLLVHVLRRGRQHPQHQVAFTTTSAMPREPEQRRVGKPRPNWINSNMKKTWEIIFQNNPLQPFHAFDRFNQLMREQTIAQARLYQPPFQ